MAYPQKSGKWARGDGSLWWLAVTLLCPALWLGSHDVSAACCCCDYQDNANGSSNGAGCCTPTNGRVQAKATGRLNDTGITLCGDYAEGHSGKHSNDVTCSRLTDVDGDPVPPAKRVDGAGKPTGQDGHVGRDVSHNDNRDGHAGFSFTKVGASGRALAIQNQAWRDGVPKPQARNGLASRITSLAWFGR